MNLNQPFLAAAAQISPVFMNKQETIEKYAEWIHEAGRQGIELVVTPETGIPTYPYWRNNFGYTSPESAALWKDTVVSFYDQSIRIPSPETETLAKACASAGVVAVVGLNEQDDRDGSATLYNTMLFIDRDGTLLGRHRKLMPTHQERFFWGRGDASDLQVFDVHFGKLGGLICFENHMTLLKAVMAVKGEEVHAACWPGWWSYGGKGNSVRDMSGEERPLYLSDQDSAIREYAFETQSFVVSASMYLPEETIPDEFPFKKTASWKWAMGGSAIANPFGAYVQEPVFRREELVMAEIDPNDRIVAKNVFDCMGHYSRWDVVSLRVRDEDFSPTGSARAPRRIKLEHVEAVAEKHHLPPEKVETILRELESLAVSVEG